MLRLGKTLVDRAAYKVPLSQSERVKIPTLGRRFTISMPPLLANPTHSTIGQQDVSTIERVVWISYRKFRSSPPLYRYRLSVIEMFVFRFGNDHYRYRLSFYRFFLPLSAPKLFEFRSNPNN